MYVSNYVATSENFSKSKFKLRNCMYNNLYTYFVVRSSYFLCNIHSIITLLHYNAFSFYMFTYVDGYIVVLL